MSVKKERDDALRKAASHGSRRSAPGWYVRLRIRWAARRVAEIERQLAGEFGVTDNSPLIEELRALQKEAAELQQALADRR